jgi:glycosyltransferase involved in cell wall biosynthesis/predicted Zn-dependent protease
LSSFSSKALGIVWEGPQLELHSFAQVNREICLRLIERGHEMALIPSRTGDRAAQPVSGQAVLAGRFHRSLERSVLAHVRHQWPPSFAPPKAGHWVMIQPWEYGSLPRCWIGPMSDLVDEIWAYTRFVRDCYLTSGVPAERVHIVPLGVDTGRFRPAAAPYPLKTTKPFKFLFVGGSIHRKGIDILLGAYTSAFSAGDDVCLVIKDLGANSFYRGQTATERIERLQAQCGAPEIEYVPQELSPDQLAGLYTACDCLVHPYRGEGFGLPIAEAMACGLPVIVTGHGAALDYCTEDNAYLIPARIMHFRKKQIGDLVTVDYPFLAEPDAAALESAMRAVVEHCGEARDRGRSAAEYVRRNLTWDHTVDAILARLRILSKQPIRRSIIPRRDSIAALAPAPDAVAEPVTPPPVSPAARPRVSLSMIVKNEEEGLASCLESVAGLVDEIVVVDTGSSDGTASIAARFGARVSAFEWVDSFAAARNESLRQARGDWIFWLDADERLDQENRSRLRSLISGLKDENAAYLMRQRSPAGPGSAAAVVVDQVRLFRRLPGVLWSYRVHEQILPALRRTDVDLRRSEVVIQHGGHEDQSVRRRKLDRDLRLLLLEIAEQPEHPFTLFNLGALYHEIGRPAEALPLLERSLARSKPSASIVTKLHALKAGCLRQLDRHREALDACRAGLRNAPGDDELRFLEALVMRELGDPVGAEAALLQLLGSSRGAGYTNGDDSLRGYKAHHNLAVIYEETGRAAEAEAQWRAAVADNAQFLPGWIRLGELYLKEKRWSDLESAALGLSACPSGDARARALRARGHAARSTGAGTATTGPEASSGAFNTSGSPRPRVSLCMIVRDAEATLGACLDSVRELVDEMIVVDTGSTDRTRDVATERGGRVHRFAWVNDFSAARNHSIEQATGDWIFWLDADEWLDEASRRKLSDLFANLKWENAAYVMQQLSTTDDSCGSQVAVDQVRLFRRDAALRWEYRVHEQILLAIRKAGHDLRRTDVVIQHGGYAPEGSSEKKLERNLALLLLQESERPEDPITLYQLGLIYQRMGRAAQALPLLERSLTLMPPDYSVRPRLFGAIARAHDSLGDAERARLVCRSGRAEYACDDGLLFLEASLLCDRGELAEAEARVQQLLRLPAGQQFAAGDAGARGYKARNLLAEIYRRQQKLAQAEAEWRKIVAEQPRFVPAWRAIGELCLSQGRWADFDDVVRSLGRTSEPEAARLLARAGLARNCM